MSVLQGCYKPKVNNPCKTRDASYLMSTQCQWLQLQSMDTIIWRSNNCLEEDILILMLEITAGPDKPFDSLDMAYLLPLD